jgi:hypothetical protein
MKCGAIFHGKNLYRGNRLLKFWKEEQDREGAGLEKPEVGLP